MLTHQDAAQSGTGDALLRFAAQRLPTAPVSLRDNTPWEDLAPELAAGKRLYLG
jgi:hypothetical protein